MPGHFRDLPILLKYLFTAALSTQPAERLIDVWMGARMGGCSGKQNDWTYGDTRCADCLATAPSGIAAGMSYSKEKRKKEKGKKKRKEKKKKKPQC